MKPSPAPRLAPRALRTLLIAAALVTLIPASPASAREELLVYLDSGAAWPVHPAEFGEFWSTGWGFGTGLGIPLTREWQLNGHIHYSRYDADGGRQAGDLLLSGPGGVTVPVARIDGRDLTVMTLMAEVRFLIPTRTPTRTWFLAFGFGVGDTFTGDATVKSVDPTMDPIVIVGESDAAFGDRRL
jgi:hypothetical protein